MSPNCNRCGAPIQIVRIVGKSKSIALDAKPADGAQGNYAVHFGQAEKIVAGQQFTGTPFTPHKQTCKAPKGRRR